MRSQSYISIKTEKPKEETKELWNGNIFLVQERRLSTFIFGYLYLALGRIAAGTRTSLQRKDKRIWHSNFHLKSKLIHPLQLYRDPKTSCGVLRKLDEKIVCLLYLKALYLSRYILIEEWFFYSHNKSKSVETNICFMNYDRSYERRISIKVDVAQTTALWNCKQRSEVWKTDSLNLIIIEKIL